MSIIVPTDRQHTVSQVVLRQFALNGDLSLYDSDELRFSRKGPRMAFHMPFDQHDPVGAEDLWGDTERDLPKMYAALRARTALGDPVVEDLIRRVLALHWARSRAMKDAHVKATETVKRRHMEELAASPEFLRSAMLKVTGLHAAGPGALEWFNERIHDQAVEESGEEWWSGRNSIHFAEATKKMNKSAIQIGYAPTGSDFVISDAPVITGKANHDGLGPHQQVALGDANEICMPLSSDIVVALGPDPKEVDLDPDAVTRYNDLQLRARIRWVGCKPGGAADKALRATLPVRTWAQRSD